MPNFLWIFIFFLGLAYARNIQFSVSTNHHRHTRDIISEKFLNNNIDGFILKECKRNNLNVENQSELETALVNMDSCFKRKTIFLSSQSDYLNNMEECSKTPKELVTKCLPNNLKYLPDMYFKSAKALVKLYYKDNSIMQGTPMTDCEQKIMQEDAQTYYANCLLKLKEGNTNNDNLLSKTSLCRTAKEFANCFAETMLNKCKKHSDIETFTQDYVKSQDEICSL
ncbi:uncharacterized protein LOC126879762 [Diabrotica virgifera virgifera]|uniref:27 kDa hemolymph protein-like n=1 Tax=Diabrotica virgifera virgifera TaxID=50390 RepID=A0ABM5JM07_DIAVI|nr:uncharacterized protein LOC126879762 [Diabrotica virgifera virgifera]